MRRMRVSQKLLAFCVSFTIPTAVLLYYYAQSVDETITFARKEQCGLRYNQPLRALMQAPREAALDDLATAERSRCVAGSAGADLDTAAGYQALQQAWSALRASASQTSARQFQ